MSANNHGITSATHKHPYLRLTPMAAACALALIAAGCGGGGSGGGGNNGNESSSLSSEEQAALAASAGSGAGSLAQGLAEGAADGADSAGEGGTASSLDPVTAATTTTVDCNDGELRILDDLDTDIDIDDEDFPTDSFRGSIANSDGVTNHLAARGDCDDANFTYEGSIDVIQVTEARSTDGSAIVYRAGGYDGPNLEDAPVLDEDYTSASAVGSSRLRGEFYACNGCVGGDLNEFNGAVDLDTTAVGFLDMAFDFDTQQNNGSFAITLGESLTTPFELQTTDVGNDDAKVDINGRFAADSDEGACSFDVTYETIEPPTVQDFSTGDPTTVNGEIDVTFNDSGTEHRVEYDGNGNVFVDGEFVELSDDVEDDCDFEA